MNAISLVLALLLSALIAGTVHAQLYVGGYDPVAQSEKVATFDPTTGAVINPSFITGLAGRPDGLALDGHGNLFVKDGGKIGKYDAQTGAPINAYLVTNLPISQSLALDGNGHLLVGTLDGAIRQYDANSGALINSTFIYYVPHPYGIALDGKGHLFAATFTLDTIQEYDASTGAAINTNLVNSLLSDPWGIVADGSGHLFVANEASSRIGEYNASTGATISASLFTSNSATGLAMDAGGNLYAAGLGTDILVSRYDAVTGIVTSFHTGLNDSEAIAIAPEPSAAALTGIALSSLLTRRRRWTAQAHQRRVNS